MLPEHTSQRPAGKALDEFFHRERPPGVAAAYLYGSDAPPASAAMARIPPLAEFVRRAAALEPSAG